MDGSDRRALERHLVAAAKRRLDRLALYPRPVRTARVRLRHAPHVFRLPWFRRFRGYAIGPLVLLRMPLEDAPEDLIVHELCHVWQFQHRPVRLWLSYVWQGYRHNEHEIQARDAVARTR